MQWSMKIKEEVLLKSTIFKSFIQSLSVAYWGVVLNMLKGLKEDSPFPYTLRAHHKPRIFPFPLKFQQQTSGSD